MAAKESWGTRVGLVLAMAGSAVGLGNFLRFPAQAAQNGGGAFIIPYLISFVLLGIPLAWVEWAIGRHGGQYGHHSTPGMLDRLGPQRWLKYLGAFGLFSCFTIASYYCYIESWTLAYVVHSLMGTFKTTAPTTFFPQYLGIKADSISALPAEATFWFVLTLALNVWVLSRGLEKGIEMAAKIGMPILLIFAIVLGVRGLLLHPGDPGVVQSPLAGLNFVWEPKPAGLLNPTTWLAAAGQIFFTLSMGLGSIHCYAAYVGKNKDIALNGASAAWVNEFVEVVLASAILIPIATAYLGLNEVQTQTLGGSGFGIGFLTLPTLFNNWGWFAPVAGAMWFGLLFFAGITSSVSMGQPLMAFLEDELDVSRIKSALLFGLATFLLGFLCVWLYPNSFNEFDFWSGTFSLIAFAMGEIIVFSWIFGVDKGWDEITRGADMKVPRFYRPVIKYVTPTFITVVFVAALFKPVAEWGAAFSSLFSGHGWPFAADSVIGKVLHVGDANYVWFDNLGHVTPAFVEDLTRTVLLLVFLGCCGLVWRAWHLKARRAL